MSAWSGIRPLATDPDAQDTASASRDHVVSMDTDGMITIAGSFPLPLLPFIFTPLVNLPGCLASKSKSLIGFCCMVFD